MQQQLLLKEPSYPSALAPGSCPITRYNYFLQIYNQPSNKLPSVELEPMPLSWVYTFCFQRVKRNRFKVLMIPLLFIPLLNAVIPILAWYCLIVYYSRCRIHLRNKDKTVDPFTNMVYDQTICHNLGKDHYFFEVELRELQGFTFNYNDKMKDQLNLRKERGKVKFMIYNGFFWAHYHEFLNYKSLHWFFAVTTSLVAVGANVMWYFVIF